MATLQTIEEALRQNKSEAARAAATEYILHGADPSAAADEVGRVLARVYSEFVVAAVHDFYEAAIPTFEEPLAARIRASIQSDIDLTLEWNKRLDGLGNERLVNQLTDSVKANDMPQAEASAQLLIGSASRAEERLARARQVGNVLGPLIHEKERAAALVKAISRNPQKFGIDVMIATEMEEEFHRASVAAARRERPAGALSRQELTQAVVELSRSLPGRMAIHQAKPEDFENFNRQLRAMLRCGINSFGNEKFHEITMILVEFSPKELSSAAAMAGVEQRLYPTLGRTARTVASKTFSEVGSLPTLSSVYANFARQKLYTRIGKYAVEAMGLFQNADFVPFLIQVMGDAKAAARSEAEFALGTIGGDPATKALFSALQSNFNVRVLDGDRRRDAITILSALGRAARALPPDQRTGIVAQVVKMLPKDDTEFTVRVLTNYFSGKIEALDPRLLSWAAQSAVGALWTIDRPELTKAAKQSPLGFRQPLIDLLEKLAPHARQTINQTAMAFAKTYSGAYLALGELYAKIPDHSNIPVLKQLLFNTSLHDDTKPKSAYTRELVRDAATEEQTDISKDQVIASLIYAIDKIGTDESREILADLFQQVQGGQMPKPGKETANILMEAHMKSAKASGQSAFPVPGQAAEDPTLEAPRAPSVTENDLELIKELQANYMFAGKRREKKVAAMAALAQRHILAAQKPIMVHLTDKDPIIAAAALTALIELGSGPAAQPVLNQYLDGLVSALEVAENEAKIKIGDALSKFGPKKSPLKEKLEALGQKPGIPMAVKSVLAKITGVVPQAAKPASPKPGEPAAADKPPTAADKFMPKGGELTNLDKKRAYMMARQEWIKGGKRGPEPVPPE
ncbi:MAG: hypothetical protein K1X53_00530 [Candidatus Sumerlaeaceae bacterium]|nr:hypothetical protein [Candidatus Sumerlaeaceae bacterium]